MSGKKQRENLLRPLSILVLTIQKRAISQIARRRTNNDEGVGEKGLESGVRRQVSGERIQITGAGRTEDSECRPSSDYAVSKLDVERRLRALYDEGKLYG